MIPQEVADVRDILEKQCSLSPDAALAIAWTLYDANVLRAQ